ncbi:hypothetical protein BLA29_005586, partial [Euroglyphus maynei]
MLTPECDCTVKDEGGWEITCFLNGNDMNAYEDSLSTTNNHNLNENNKWLESEDGIEFDYGGEIPIAFIVKYDVQHQTLKIECDKGAPAFKPALFQ